MTITIEQFVKGLLNTTRKDIADILQISAEDIDVDIVTKNLPEVLTSLYCVAKAKNNDMLPTFYLATYQDKQVIVTQSDDNFEIEPAEEEFYQNGNFSFKDFLTAVWYLYADYDANFPPEEHMLAYGYEPDFEIANESDTNVRIWRETFYYENTWTNDTTGFVRDEYNNIIVFDDYATAQSYIAEQAGTAQYVLKHGEYSEPTFKIVK